MDVLFWDGGVFKGGLNAFYFGPGWATAPPNGAFFPNNPYDRSVSNPVPEPASELLFAVGALVIATTRRRRRP
jgi:hypothetical protein